MMGRKRPQEPVRPFPYDERAVHFVNQVDGTVLNGTLTLPAGEGRFPAAVLITGSGAHDRNETILGHKPFLVIADHLTRAGIAVLRYDDRHYRMKPAKGLTFTSADFAGDAGAAVAFLREEAGIDGSCIGLIGHSEGGLIAPMTASQEESGVGFIISLAGPGVPGMEVLKTQTRELVKDARYLEITDRWFTLLDSFQDTSGLKEAYTALYRSTYGPFRFFKRLMARLTSVFTCSKWYFHFCKTDPAPFWERVRCPALVLFGEHDVQVDAASNSAALEQALSRSGSPDHAVITVPGANHLFQKPGSGRPDTLKKLYREYNGSRETIHPEVLEMMVAWILTQWKKRE